MLVLEDVPSSGTERIPTLHGDVDAPTYPRTAFMELMERVHKRYHTRDIARALGIDNIDVHLLRCGSKTCDVEEVKRLLKKGGIDYE